MEREKGTEMSTAQELAQNVGKTALLRVSGTSLWFEVEIMDARQRYGNLDYKVKPVMGEGEQWHQADSMKLVLDNN